MAKKTQIDRAIEALNEKKAGLEAKYVAEIGGINAAIEALKAQQRKPSKPRAVARVAEQLA